MKMAELLFPEFVPIHLYNLTYVDLIRSTKCDDHDATLLQCSDGLRSMPAGENISTD